MFYIFFIFLLFIATLTGHIFFCRNTRKAGLHAKVFVLGAMASLVFYMVVVQLPFMVSQLDPDTLWGLPFKITAGMIFILLVPIYLCFYVLTQLTSPSKKILLTIARRGELSRSDILLSIEQEDFIMTRLNDLLACGCVKETDGKYILTSEGQKIAATLNVMQVILGRNVGG